MLGLTDVLLDGIVLPFGALQMVDFLAHVLHPFLVIISLDTLFAHLDVQLEVAANVLATNCIRGVQHGLGGDMGEIVPD